MYYLFTPCTICDGEGERKNCFCLTDCDCDDTCLDCWGMGFISVKCKLCPSDDGRCGRCGSVAWTRAIGRNLGLLVELKYLPLGEL